MITFPVFALSASWVAGMASIVAIAALFFATPVRCTPLSSSST